MKSMLKRLATMWAMAGAHCVVKLRDGTVVVRMSDEFYEWTYGENYAQWKASKQQGRIDKAGDP